MIPTEEAHGLHPPRGNSAFFTCGLINHHPERQAEPGAGHSDPVRSLTQAATARESRTGLTARTQTTTELLTRDYSSLRLRALHKEEVLEVKPLERERSVTYRKEK